MSSNRKQRERNTAVLPLLHHTIIGTPRKGVLVFLHGFMGRGEDWIDLANEISSDFQCILVDLPGHGRSVNFRTGEIWSMENTARWVLHLLQETTTPPVNLVGYSMGGRLALYLALIYPHFFRKVVLESASPGLKDKQAREARIQLDETRAQQIVSEPMEIFLQKWYSQPLFDTLQQSHKVQPLIASRKQNDPRALAKSLREMGTGVQPPLWDRLPELKIPLLLIVGEKDFKFCTIAREMSAQNKQVEVITVEGCGHNVHLEAPEKFKKILLDFLKRKE
ncbi:MAG: 2-succinyl-6-hydroxy-2,4-cyclohexadiene-1-carboxylate synthase [Calditrichaeota bacterium]|nr:MAG: 2-succinyl-6-hydroxy-2,4-cyclohexadiene-1-carboxylate synthase [Calditrichota bacterium]